MYIDNIKLSSIIIYLSFKTKASAANKSSVGNMSLVLESLGGVFMNVDNFKVELKGFKLKKCYDSTT